MDKAMLLAMLAQQAPILLQGLKSPFETTFRTPMHDSDTTNTLMEMVGNRGYDPVLIQAKMNPGAPLAEAASLAIDSLVPEMNGKSKGFPSDGISQLDFQNISQRLLNNIPIATTPAVESAVTLLNNNNNTQPNSFLDNFLDSDLDDIHSSEMWQAGNSFNPDLKKWYLKNKR